jgi:hypothetical protein
MLSPHQIFEDNIRPADLMLKVFRLLEHDAPNTEAELQRALRDLVKADKDEGLTVIYNEIFLGLIRERAQVAPSAIRRSALSNLLRQAIVGACTALETFLPALLRTNLDEVIKAKKRDFIPKDKELMGHLETLKFDLADVLRILASPDPLYISNKLIAFLNVNLSGRRGVHVVGLLLGLEDPWRDIARQLNRKPTDLATIIENTISRRNDIVHRADRDKRNLDGDAQPISLSQAMQAVDTIRHVCLCLDELVAEQMKTLRSQWADTSAVQDAASQVQPEGAA